MRENTPILCGANMRELNRFAFNARLGYLQCVESFDRRVKHRGVIDTANGIIFGWIKSLHYIRLATDKTEQSIRIDNFVHANNSFIFNLLA